MLDKIKKAKTKDEAWSIQENYKDQPHGWIQWKGTNVCMDIKCECGKMSHVDAEFLYYVKCPYCDKVYSVNGHVELIEVTDEKVSEAFTPEKDESY